MRTYLVIISALLVVALIVLQQSSGLSLGETFGAFLGWPMEQKLALAAIMAAVVCMLVLAVWQSDKIAQQTKAIALLKNRLNGIRDEISAIDQQQTVADAAVRHLVGSDPVANIDDIHLRLAQTEARTAEQAAQTEAVDLQSRIDEIRHRQQALRTQLGSVSEKRRVIGPILGEVKERQALIERSLSELEKDENGKGIDARIEESEAFVNHGHARLEILETMFGKFEQLRDRMQHLQDVSQPLLGTESGMKLLVNDVISLQKNIDTALASLEKDDDGTIGDRLDRLSKSKSEIEQRISALTNCFESLESIRRDVDEYFQRLHASLNSKLKS